MVATYTYDELNRLTDLVHSDALNTILASYSYELGPNGNRLSLTEGTGRYVEYDYDDLYRLLSETVTDPINDDHFSQWAYDAVGNRSQQEIDGIITLYTYNDNDHLLTETKNSIVTRYDYDDNGNTLTKTIDTVIDTTYSYSKDNRMLTADTSTSSISYSYDAGGIRQSQTVNGQTINYLVDPNRSYHQVLEEQDDLFMPQVVYTYGDDLISQTNAQGVYTFGYDGLGSTRILTDVNGTVQNSYGYQAFGELDYQYGAIENNYLFTGEQYDNNVGFYYLRARFYNPSIGRFQNMDVFPGMQFEPKSLHKYLYTHADPINNIDPSGYMTLTEQMVGIGGLAILGGYAVTSTKFTLYNSTAVDDGFDAFTIGWLAILAGTSSNLMIHTLVETLTRENDHDTEDLYMAVGDTEMLSIWDCNCISKGINDFPKQFFRALKPTIDFGVWQFNRVGREFYVIRVTISRQMFNALHDTDADAFLGDVRTVPHNLLPAFNEDVRRHGGITELGEYK